MQGIIASVIGLAVVALLAAGAIALAKRIKNGKIRPSAAIFLGFIGVLVVMGLFVVLMGILKNAQGLL